MGDAGRAVDGTVLALLDADGKFLRRLADDQVTLERLGLELRTGAEGQRRGCLDRLAVLAHRLAGAAGTFGFVAIGDRAIALEDAVVDGHDRREIGGLVTELAAALEQGLRGA